MPANKHTVCGLVTAAGLSARMGTFKPMLPLHGKTVIENTVDSILTGGAESVVAVVGNRGRELERLLRGRYGSRVIIVWNREYDKTDMLRSVQLGCGALPPCDAFFLLPGDMPAVCQTTFQAVLETWEKSSFDVVFPTLAGRRKHPPLISAGMIPEILAFSGDGGLRQLWSRCEDRIGCVPVDDRGVALDLDTPEDYRSCREQHE